jgi:AcrR family transcriptional regulator
MMVISSPYEETGRVRQKARTRAALIAATRELLATGVTPTVEQAADRAEISRTTAYRYFPNRRALLAATYPDITVTSLLGDDPPDDPAERLELATEQFGRHLLEHEHELRTQLRLALESGADGEDRLPLRQGRGIGWFEDALSPLRGELTKAEVRRLAVSMRAAFGIEPLVWLTDVAGLSRDEALDVMRSSVRALLAAAIGGGPAARSRKGGARRTARRVRA